MKIFDCFMYFDEETILELRLNILDPYVDYFVIVESNYNHNGKKKKLNFNPKKFIKFQKKIIYLVQKDEPKNIEKILIEDDEKTKNSKYIFNAIFRENSQRNFILNGLNEAKEEDIIMVSDVDEIPNLKNIDWKIENNKFFFFNQKMYYYKFNLRLPNFKWTGTKACKKRDLQSPQWLRNIKDRNYPFYRLDILFSKTKYRNIKFITNGGWHFTNIKSPLKIRHKLKSYLHHLEFEKNPLSHKDIKKMIVDKKTLYDLRVDQKKNKFVRSNSLKKCNINTLPEYLQLNTKKYKNWIFN